MISIKNLHPDIEESELRNIINEFGTIISLHVCTSCSNAYHSALATIEMYDKSEEQALLDWLDGDLIKGIPVVLERLD